MVVPNSGQMLCCAVQSSKLNEGLRRPPSDLSNASEMTPSAFKNRADSTHSAITQFSPF